MYVYIYIYIFASLVIAYFLRNLPCCYWCYNHYCRWDREEIRSQRCGFSVCLCNSFISSTYSFFFYLDFFFSLSCLIFTLLPQVNVKILDGSDWKQWNLFALRILISRKVFKLSTNVPYPLTASASFGVRIFRGDSRIYGKLNCYTSRRRYINTPWRSSKYLIFHRKTPSINVIYKAFPERRGHENRNLQA